MGRLGERTKRVSVGEAISHIQSGDHLVIGGMAAEPLGLVKELVRQRSRLDNVTIYTSFPINEALYASPEAQGSLNIKIFSVGSLGPAVERGQASYLPCHFSEIAGYFSNGTLPLDVALVQVSPPDRDGFCSFGVSVEYYPEAVRAARLVIGEVNESMPRTHGDSLIHVSEFAFTVETEHPLPEYRVAPPGETERTIGTFCAQLIPDGAILQFGPGKLHGAVLSGLGDKKELGVHSGLISDGVLDLLERGVITGETKTLNRGKVVCTSAIGTQKLYDFVDGNREVEFYPASYTHSIAFLRRLDGFISLNVALEVDLLGQVNSETVQGVLVNGLGGMVDFIRGARASRGGKVIFCLPSTVRKGKISRIVPRLSPDSPVTATRADVDYFVSEFGVAELRGKTEGERAEAICEIAHPNFREQLRKSIK